jgi:hypothetical protein
MLFLVVSSPILLDQIRLGNGQLALLLCLAPATPGGFIPNTPGKTLENFTRLPGMSRRDERVDSSTQHGVEKWLQATAELHTQL